MIKKFHEYLKEVKINYKELEKNNKLTIPKISVDKVYLNNYYDLPHDIRIKATPYFEDDNYLQLHKMRVRVDLIVPTQKNLTINNIKKVDKVTNDTDAILLKYKSNFYVVDGHHRIAVNILKGVDIIIAYVIDLGG